MSQNDNNGIGGLPASSKVQPTQTTIRSYLAIPAPIKYLFDQTPLTTHPSNELPTRLPVSKNDNLLFIFTNPNNALQDTPSFNPNCLKWQVFLKFNRIPFRAVSSNNHASPSGALPFLLPCSQASTESTPLPISSSKLKSWALAHGNVISTPGVPGAPGESSMHSPYYSLIGSPIRALYLYALYLCPSTFKNIAEPLYIYPISSNMLVRYLSARALRSAALSEVSTVLDRDGMRNNVDRLLEDGDEALGALSILLGKGDWFDSNSSNDKSGKRVANGVANLDVPGILDAAVFAYTHVVLSLFSAELPETPAGRLFQFVQARSNLVAHRDRILDHYFSVI